MLRRQTEAQAPHLMPRAGRSPCRARARLSPSRSNALGTHHMSRRYRVRRRPPSLHRRRRRPPFAPRSSPRPRCRLRPVCAFSTPRPQYCPCRGLHPVCTCRRRRPVIRPLCASVFAPSASCPTPPSAPRPRLVRAAVCGVSRLKHGARPRPIVVAHNFNQRACAC